MAKINRAVITDYDLVTSYGSGVNSLWDGLLLNKSALGRLNRFSTEKFSSGNAAIVPELDYNKNESLVMQMLNPLIRKNISSIPDDALLILASTVGEIDLLEKDVLASRAHRSETRPQVFLRKIEKLARLKRAGIFVSCACASSSTAIAQGASLIRQGKEDCVLVVAADSVNEFVFSGFSALMALDKDKARPFDKNRSGLSLGEAAGFILLMSAERAKREKRNTSSEVLGWGLSCDANHMTGPAREGQGLIRAFSKALQSAGISQVDIGCISAHGTGTLYNDAMELKAFRQVFKDLPLPIYSVKGGTGHTLGSAGLVETLVALKVLREKVVPATVGLENIDDQAVGWADISPRELKKDIAVINNCGFGGINAVLVIKK